MTVDRRDDGLVGEGGDAVCLLAEVCERCGAFNERADVPCWRCDRSAHDDGPSGVGATMRA